MGTPWQHRPVRPHVRAVSATPLAVGPGASHAARDPDHDFAKITASEVHYEKTTALLQHLRSYPFPRHLPSMSFQGDLLSLVGRMTSVKVTAKLSQYKAAELFHNVK